MRLPAIASLFLASACADPPGVEEAPPLEVWIDEPAADASVEGTEVLLRAGARARGELALARLRVGDEEQKRLPLNGERQAIEHLLVLQPGANRIVLEVDDTDGNTASVEREVTSVVQPPVIRELIASPNPARPRQPVELQWAVEGEAPISLWIGGEGEVEGDTLELVPDLSTTYMLTATNRWGSDTAMVELVVEPELVPNVQVVAAGSRQSLRVAGLLRPGAFSVSGGTIERPEDGHTWTWTVPEEPGTYEVQVEHADGTWTRPVEVRTIDPVELEAIDVGGHPAPSGSCRACVLADGAGQVWVPTAGGVMRGTPGGTWQLVYRGLEHPVASLHLLPDGRPLAIGRPTHWSSEWVASVWEEATGSWLPWDDGPPVLRMDEFVIGPTGWMFSVQMSGTGNWRRAPGGDWIEIPERLGQQVAFGADGTLYVASAAFFDEPPELLAVAPHANTLEPTGILFPDRPQLLHALQDGTILAVADGLWRLDPGAGTIEDASTGLGDGCDSIWCVGALLEVGETLYAAGEAGIFEWRADRWEPLYDATDLPFSPTPLHDDGQGGLLVTGPRGLFHLAAGEQTLRPLVGQGLIGPLRFGAHATAPDGTVALAQLPGNLEPAALSLREKGEADWRAIGPEPESFGRYARDPAFDGAGHLYFRWELDLMRLPAGSTSWEQAEILPAFPGNLGPWAVLDDGSVIAAVHLADVIYRLAPGAEAWEALPSVAAPTFLTQAPDGSIWSYGEEGLARRLRAGAGDWEPIAPAAADMPYLHRGAWLSFAADGVPWALAHSQGVQRLEDGIWRPVGSGTCGMSANTLFFGADGIYCLGDGKLQRLETIEGAEVWVDVRAFAPGTEIQHLIEGPDGQAWIAFESGGLFELRAP